MSAGLDNLLLIVNELEKSYLQKRPWDQDIIRDISGSFRYAIKKLVEEKKLKATND